MGPMFIPNWNLSLESIIHLVLALEEWKMKERWDHGLFLRELWRSGKRWQESHCKEVKKDYSMKLWKWNLDCAGDPKILDIPKLWDILKGPGPHLVHPPPHALQQPGQDPEKTQQDVGPWLSRKCWALNLAWPCPNYRELTARCSPSWASSLAWTCPNYWEESAR